ncbi:MAG: F0F1 ATP synthase subunit A [Clostridiales bacterium]|nr:F0F1 ATP synthase subunit A [Clostridiales bacterium]
MGNGLAGTMLLSSSDEVDFFIRSYYEFQLFGQTLSINTTMVSIVIVCIIMLGLIVFARHEIMKNYDNPAGEPNAVQNAVEMLVEMMDGLVESNMGSYAPKYRNYIITLMAFILLSNISGLIGLRAPTADFGTTLTLALITFVMIEYAWIKGNGIRFILDLFEPIPIFFPINLISEFATPISMSLRLFGNVLAGTIMLGLWYGLMPWFAKIGIPAFLHAYFDVFSGAIQTFVFGMLTMTFIRDKYPD